MLFGSTMLEVAIGLFFIFFLGSVVVSHVNEIVVGILQLRSQQLRKGITELVMDDGFSEQLRQDPLITSLCSVKNPIFFAISKVLMFIPERLLHFKVQPKRGASYIDTSTFSLALFRQVWAEGTAIPNNLNDIRAGIAASTLPDKLKNMLTGLLNDGLIKVQAGESELQQALGAVGDWYNQKMDRVSGAYKRVVYVPLLIIALSVSIIFNIDTINIAQTLSNNQALRSAVITQAQQATQGQTLAQATPTFDQAREQLADLGTLIGWPNGQIFSNVTLGQWIGWLLSGLAFSFGAPFWFDLLSKVVNLRSSGQPPSQSSNATASK